MSASANNARSSSMGPPANPLDRISLAQRGGELYKPKPAHSKARPVNAAANATSIAGPSRQTSSSSRNTSFSTSLGPGARQPFGQVHRSQSAMANTRLQIPTPNSSRPSTASDVHSETSGMSPGEKKRKGMLPISSNPRNKFSQPGIKESYDTQLNHNSIWASRSYSRAPSRVISLSAAFSSLSLHNKTQSTPVVDLEPPSTPSQLPKSILRVAMPTETPSPSKSPRKPSVITPFLTRDSNTRAASGSSSWGRSEELLKTVDKDMDGFKQHMPDTNVDRIDLREMLNMYKARGRSMTIAQ